MLGFAAVPGPGSGLLRASLFGKVAKSARGGSRADSLDAFHHDPDHRSRIAMVDESDLSERN